MNIAVSSCCVRTRGTHRSLSAVYPSSPGGTCPGWPGCSVARGITPPRGRVNAGSTVNGRVCLTEFNSAPAQPGVENVAQCIAEQVEGEHGDRDRRAGEDGEGRRPLEPPPTADGQHPAPGRVGWRHAQAEEGERR